VSSLGVISRSRSKKEANATYPVPGSKGKFGVAEGLESGENAMAKLKIRPLNDKVVVKRVEAEAKTKGGIVLPDTAKEKPKEGVVISLGTGKLLESGSRAEFQVKEKDRIIFSSYAGTEVKIDGEEYLILNEDDVLAVID
jgi:chaperonin GroES